MSESGGWRVAFLRVVKTGYLIALAVVVWFFFKDFDFDATSSTAISLPLMSAAIALGLFNRFWMAGAFLLSLKASAAPGTRGPLFLQALAVFAAAWMSRYLPIKGAWAAHRLLMAKNLSVSKTQMAVGTALETLTQFLGMTIVAALFVLLGSESFFQPGYVLLALGFTLGLFIAFGYAPLLRWSVNLVSNKALGKKPDFATPRLPIYIAIAGVQIITACLSGGATGLIVLSIYGPISFTQFITVIGLTALANLSSSLAFFAPAGIGVRETILILGLEGILTLELATLVALVTRLWTIVIDILFFLLSRLINSGKTKGFDTKIAED